MNRRKLFGFLAAAPVAVAAKSGLVTVENKGDIVPNKPKKWYSTYDHFYAFNSWQAEYISRKWGLPAGSNPFPFHSKCDFYYFDGKWIDLPGKTTKSELNQAFADACINGEVPGVWWE